MPSAGMILGLVLGLAVGAAGLYMMRWGRTVRGADEEPVGLLGTILTGSSLATRYVIGFCLLVLGYHLISYSLPAGTLWLRVPPERLWIMGLAIAVVVAGSITIDMLERR